eukprot:1034932-Rhodomonas_salina.2
MQITRLSCRFPHQISTDQTLFRARLEVRARLVPARPQVAPDWYRPHSLSRGIDADSTALGIIIIIISIIVVE